MERWKRKRSWAFVCYEERQNWSHGVHCCSCFLGNGESLCSSIMPATNANAGGPMSSSFEKTDHCVSSCVCSSQSFILLRKMSSTCWVKTHRSCYGDLSSLTCLLTSLVGCGTHSTTRLEEELQIWKDINFHLLANDIKYIRDPKKCTRKL